MCIRDRCYNISTGIAMPRWCGNTPRHNPKEGKSLGTTKTITNTYVIKGAVAVLTITARTRPPIDVLIDSRDVPRLQSAGMWYQGYKARQGCYYPANGIIQLSRFLMECPPAFVVDHID